MKTITVELITLNNAESNSLFFVLSGPCGTGKTSLAMAWLKAESDLGYSRSITTRKARKIEEQYDYVSRDQFKEMIEDRQFVQWVNPSYDEFYGTLLSPLEEAVKTGQDLVFDYCTEGYLNLKRRFPHNVVGIFVIAPSLEALSLRLKQRGTEEEEEIKLRYSMALQDLNFIDNHQYFVINDDFSTALQKIRAIRVAEKCRREHQISAISKYSSLAIPSLLRYYDAPSAS